MAQLPFVEGEPLTRPAPEPALPAPQSAVDAQQRLVTVYSISRGLNAPPTPQVPAETGPSPAAKKAKAIVQGYVRFWLGDTVADSMDQSADGRMRRLSLPASPFGDEAPRKNRYGFR